MRRLFVIAATLGICALALMGCRSETAFDAGSPLTAKELETLKLSLQEKGKEDGKSEEKVPENGLEGDDVSKNGELDENKTIFYYTVSGEVYHVSRDCAYLNKSANVHEGTLSQALSSGKTRSCAACSKAEEDGATSENDEMASGAQMADTDAAESENKTVVYYTESGETYHFDRNCTYLKNSKLINEGSADAALTAGKSRPCSRCGD